MATKKKAELLSELVEMALDITKKGTGPAIYLGPTVVQAAGAWTRCGPTWIVPGIGWIVLGPGVQVWNTTEGLAQLACDPEVKPTWHAIGVGIAAPTPNIDFLMLDDVVRVHPAVLSCVEAVAKGVEVAS